MTDQPLDPLREKMIAALYGELSAEEEQDFRALLAEDAGLRAEWEELREARALLGSAGEHAEVREPVPSFVFMSSPGRVAGPRMGAGDRGRSLGERLRAALRTPVPAFALVATALLILILAGFRVDRTEAGLVLRFGSPAVRAPAAGGPSEVAPAATGPSATPSLAMQMPGREPAGGTPLVPGAATLPAHTQAARGAEEFGTVGGIPVSSLGGYMTRAEFAAYAREINDLVESMLDDHQDRRRAELAYVVREVYDEMSSRNQGRYDELNAQIQQVWMGLAGLGAQTGLGERQMLPEQGGRYGVRPVLGSPRDEN